MTTITMVAAGDPLTEREMQVLHLMSHGCANREIGRRLGGVSEDTIKSYTRRILQKLKVSCRTHAVRRGFEMGLLLPHTDPNALDTARRIPPPETSLAAAMRVTNPQKQLYAALESLGWTPPGGDRRG